MEGIVADHSMGVAECLQNSKDKWSSQMRPSWWERVGQTYCKHTQYVGVSMRHPNFCEIFANCFCLLLNQCPNGLYHAWKAENNQGNAIKQGKKIKTWIPPLMFPYHNREMSRGANNKHRDTVMRRATAVYQCACF